MYGIIICWLKKLLNHINIKKLQNEDQNLAVDPWESLPMDIIETIGLHLEHHVDFVHLSLVCKSWQSNIQSIFRPKIPWLLLPDQLDCHNDLKFFNFLEPKYQNYKLPERLHGGKIVGSSKGWLVIVLNNTYPKMMFDIYLFNPIMGVEYRLPSLRKAFSFQRVELSSSKISECNVAAIVDRFILLHQYGDKRWIFLPFVRVAREDSTFVDILFYHRKLHILVNGKVKQGKIEDRRINLLDCGKTISCTVIHDFYYENSSMPPIGVSAFSSLSHHRISYLVESITGRVLLIHKHYRDKDYVEEEPNVDQDEENRSNLEDGFQIYEIKDIGGNRRLCKRRGLGKEQAAFLSCHSRFCLPVTNNMQGNCINFVMDCANDFDYQNPDLVNIKNGIYHLDNYTKEPLIPKFDYLLSPKLIWFVPNLHIQHGGWL